MKEYNNVTVKKIEALDYGSGDLRAISLEGVLDNTNRIKGFLAKESDIAGVEEGGTYSFISEDRKSKASGNINSWLKLQGSTKQATSTGNASGSNSATDHTMEAIDRSYGASLCRLVAGIYEHALASGFVVADNTQGRQQLKSLAEEAIEVFLAGVEKLKEDF